MDTWVIIVSTSRYWFNYRHSTNGFIVYRIAKALGVSDDHILFLDGTDVLNNARNAARGEVHLEASIVSQSGAINLLPEEGVEIDYRGEEVTIELLRHILLSSHSSTTAGRTTTTTTTTTSAPSTTPSDTDTTTPSTTTTAAADMSSQDIVFSARSKRETITRSFSSVLESSSTSNIFFYLAGHGGNEFFKFHDMEELDSFDLAMLIEEMKQKGKFQQLVVMMDTCQAATMANHLITPNVTFIGSSLEGENSYAWRLNEELGISTVDRFTYSLYDFFFSKPGGHLRWGLSSMTFADLMKSFRRNFLMSTPVIIQTPGTTLPVSKMNIMEFFKRKSSAERTVGRLPLPTSTTPIQHDKILVGRELLKHLSEEEEFSSLKMLLADDSFASSCGNLSFERPNMSWTVSHLTLVVVWLGIVCIVSRWLTRVSSKLDNYVVKGECCK